MKKFVEEEIWVKNYKINLPLILEDDLKKEISLYLSFNNTFYSLSKKYCNEKYELIKKETKFDALFDKYMKTNGEERSHIRKKIVDIFFDYKITKTNLIDYLLEHIFYAESDLKYVESINIKSIAKYTIDSFFEGVFKSSKLDIFNANIIKKGSYIEFKNFLRKKTEIELKENSLNYIARIDIDNKTFAFKEKELVPIDFSKNKEYSYLLKESIIKNILLTEQDGEYFIILFASIIDFPKLDFDYNKPKYKKIKTMKKHVKKED